MPSERLGNEAVPVLLESKWEAPELIVFDEYDEEEHKEQLALISLDEKSPDANSGWKFKKRLRVELENIAQDPFWGPKVRKSWRHLIITGA
jgi:hypothetical protein